MRETKKFEWDMSAQKLLIHSVSADITVDRNLEKKISMEVELSGFKKEIEEYEPKVKNVGDKFEVDLFPHTAFFPDGFFAFGFLKSGILEVQKVYLKIPDGLSFGIETTSGDTIIKDLSFNELRLSSVSGDFNVNSKEMKSLFVKTVSGDINVEDGSSKLEEMEVQSVSGDIKVVNLSFDRASVKNTSGDVMLMNVKPEFKSLDVKTISGDFSISFISRPNVHVEVETVSGDVKSNAEVLRSKVTRGTFDLGKPLSTLKFKSISGDATFNFGTAPIADENHTNKESQKDQDERLKIFEEILKSKRATKEEIKELMITLGYKVEEIEEFLSTR